MILAFVLSLVFPTFALYAIFRLCCISDDDGGDRYIKFPLAIGLAIGLTSCTYFLWIVMFGEAGPRYPIIECAPCFIVGGLLWFKKKPSHVRASSFPSIPSESFFLLRFVQVACVVGIPLCLTALIFGARATPHGEWDAWAIWNQRARFLFRAGPYWRDAFNHNLGWSHPDYPLLLPAAVARGWSYILEDRAFVPAAISVIFAVATAALLAGAVAKLRGAVSGLLAGLMLLSTDYYLRHGVYQYADTPLSFYILGTIVLTHLRSRSIRNTRAPIFLAGLCATCAAWTKNEGLLFLVCWMASVWLARILPGPRETRLCSVRAWTLGLVPVCTVLIYFKAALAPQNDILSSLTSQALCADLSDFSRYEKIFHYFGGALLEFGKFVFPTLAVYWLLVGRAKELRDRRGQFCAALALALTFTGYLFIYLATPLELSWHLKTSGGRLLLQLLPAAMFVVFVSAAPLTCFASYVDAQK